LTGNSLKVHQVVASGQWRHAVDSLQAARFLRIKFLLFLLDGGHVDLTEVFRGVEKLVKGVWGVNWFVCLGRIFAGVLEDDLLAAGVFWGRLAGE
jgi:hypothetical protein